MGAVEKVSLFHVFVNLTPSPALPLKSKGKGVTLYISITCALSLSFKGRVREGLNSIDNKFSQTFSTAPGEGASLFNWTLVQYLLG